jgi:hypothetical protein
MLIQEAIDSIHQRLDSWVRVEQVRRISGGIDLCIGIYKGRRGRKPDLWSIICEGVHEAEIRDFDGGGLEVYSSTHPAARQYTARQAELRWPCTGGEMEVLAALYRTHLEAVDDWISFDTYLPMYGPYPNAPGRPGGKFVCRGPDFLLRAYAKALREIGEPAKLILCGIPKRTRTPPKVLHFGTSYVVADAFDAQRVAVPSAPSRKSARTAER